MARRNTVEVVITAKDKASKHFKGIGKDVDGLKNALTGMAVAGAAKAAFELGKLGAMSLRTKATFAANSKHRAILRQCRKLPVVLSLIPS